MDKKEITRIIENLLVHQEHEDFDEYWKKGYNLCRQLEDEQLILYVVSSSYFYSNYLNKQKIKIQIAYKKSLVWLKIITA
tara:strand:- start:881 stop:1120 length:240 start_codon:yes stop_codon:yes gene_type:complete